MKRAAVVLFFVAALAAGCGGGGEEEPAKALEGRLLPASKLPGFKLRRTFEWDNAIDLTAQGFFLPESTPPSEVVEVAEEAGFKGGLGEQLEQEHGPGMAVIAAKFGSDDGAKDMQQRLHQEDLKQPCYGVCSQIQSNLTVAGIPGAFGAQSLPDQKPPPNAPPPFNAYAVEFTVGPYLYIVGGMGAASLPGLEGRTITKQQVLDAAKALYEQVKDKD